MFRNNFKTALRSLWRNKTFSFINIAGLAVGLTCCLLMIIFIRNELDFDRFHQKADHIYRVAFSDYLNQGGFAATPIPVGPALKDQLPEVQAVTRVAYMDPYLVKYGINQGFEPISFADGGIFNVFSFSLIDGDPNTALQDPNSIVISERMAKKYFANENPLNKILKIGSTGSLSSTVKGVFHDLPQNSHLQFDLLVSFATWQKLGWPSTLWTQMPANYTYIVLNDQLDVKKITLKFPLFVSKNVGDLLKKENNPTYNLILQPLLSIHLQSHLQSERPGAGNISYVYLFAAIAIIILGIACINFINFATAHALKRIREIGIRKVVGAQRWQLIGQLLIESFITYLFAVFLSLLLAQLLLPIFNQVAGRSFIIQDILEPAVIAGLLAVGILAGIIAGFIPAWSITRFSSIDALKGKMAGISHRSVIRKTLVTVQFAASLILIIASLVVYQQMQYVRRLAAMNQADQVIVFRMNGNLAEKLTVLKTALSTHPGIISVSASTNVPGFSNDSWPIRLTENSPVLQTENYVADENYLPTMGLTLLAGRKLEATSITDVKENFVLNETAVHALGFRNAQEAIGQRLLWGGDEKKRGSIVGVVKDFHITSLHEKIAPAIIQFAPFDWMTYNYVLVKLRPGQIGNSLAHIRKKVADIDANWLVDYKFFDRNFQLLHQKDEQQGLIFTAFAIIAISISCLGLLGLTVYATRQRLREIGVRKVLGASVVGIVRLLSKDFMLLILLATLIAFPVAWWSMNQWLQDFAYRVTISWWVFFLAISGVMLIALFTISFQAIKAAMANPVKSLRTE